MQLMSAQTSQKISELKEKQKVLGNTHTQRASVNFGTTWGPENGNAEKIFKEVLTTNCSYLMKSINLKI